MAKKNRFLYDENAGDEETRISRSQKKRDSTQLQKIGEELANLAPAKLAQLPLTEDLEQAFAEYRRIKNKEAKRRHIQYIGRLMREAQEESAFKNEEDLVSIYLATKDDF